MNNHSAYIMNFLSQSSLSSLSLESHLRMNVSKDIYLATVYQEELTSKLRDLLHARMGLLNLSAPKLSVPANPMFNLIGSPQLTPLWR